MLMSLHGGQERTTTVHAWRQDTGRVCQRQGSPLLIECHGASSAVVTARAPHSSDHWTSVADISEGRVRQVLRIVEDVYLDEADPLSSRETEVGGSTLRGSALNFARLMEEAGSEVTGKKRQNAGYAA